MSTEMTTQPQEQGPIAVRSGNLIDAKHESHRKFLIRGRDDVEIERTAGELFEGSRLLRSRELLIANLSATFQTVEEWCEARRPMLKTALITLRTEKLCLYFVPTSERYDLKLDAEMTELEVKLGNAGVGYIESFQIPERNLDRLGTGNVILLWPKHSLA